MPAEDFAFENPHLDADDAVGGGRFGGGVVDVRPQRVQGHAPFRIDFGAGDFGAVQAPGDANLDALGAQAHGVLHDPPHGALMANPAFELLRDVLRHQKRIHFRLADFLYVDVYRHAHLARQFGAQLVDVFALLADDDAGPRRVDGDAGGAAVVDGLPFALRQAFDVDAAHRGLREALGDVGTHLQIVQQVAGVVLLADIPRRRMALDDAEPQTRGADFLAHGQFLPVSSATVTVMWLVRLKMRSARPRARGRRRLMVTPSST